MIAAIVHDLKAPLTSINGFAELLVMRKGLSENEKQECYELKVYMTGYSKGSYAYFEIEDNRIGVLDKEMSSLFLKFFTVDKSR